MENVVFGSMPLALEDSEGNCGFACTCDVCKFVFFSWAPYTLCERCIRNAEYDDAQGCDE